MGFTGELPARKDTTQRRRRLNAAARLADEALTQTQRRDVPLRSALDADALLATGHQGLASATAAPCQFDESRQADHWADGTILERRNFVQFVAPVTLERLAPRPTASPPAEGARPAEWPGQPTALAAGAGAHGLCGRCDSISLPGAPDSQAGTAPRQGQARIRATASSPCASGVPRQVCSLNVRVVWESHACFSIPVAGAPGGRPRC